MQFKVPQFLDIEDKIFGPFTFSEGVYLGGGIGISFFLYRLLGLTLSILPIMLVVGFVLALTFYKPNNRPFIEMLESAMSYFLGYKLYIWKRSQIKKPAIAVKNKEEDVLVKKEAPKLNEGKLRDLAWSLDVLDMNKEKK